MSPLQFQLSLFRFRHRKTANAVSTVATVTLTAAKTLIPVSSADNTETTVLSWIVWTNFYILQLELYSHVMLKFKSHLTSI